MYKEIKDNSILEKDSQYRFVFLVDKDLRKWTFTKREAFLVKLKERVIKQDIVVSKVNYGSWAVSIYGTYKGNSIIATAIILIITLLLLTFAVRVTSTSIQKLFPEGVPQAVGSVSILIVLILIGLFAFTK